MQPDAGIFCDIPYIEDGLEWHCILNDWAFSTFLARTRNLSVFPKCQDWLWGPPSVLLSGNGKVGGGALFVWGEAAELWRWPPTPSIAEVKNVGTVTSSHLYVIFMECTKTPLFFYVFCLRILIYMVIWNLLQFLWLSQYKSRLLINEVVCLW